MTATPAIDRLVRALPGIDRKIAAARSALQAWEFSVVHRQFRERLMCQARLYLPWDYDHERPVRAAR